MSDPAINARVVKLPRLWAPKKPAVTIFQKFCNFLAKTLDSVSG